jgi:hypothetical protein
MLYHAEKLIILRSQQELMDQESAGENDAEPATVKNEEERNTRVPAIKREIKTALKTGTKREVGVTTERPAKRQKKEETPSEEEDISDDLSSEEAESGFGDSEDSDAPKSKKKTVKSKGKIKTPVKRQRKSNHKVQSEDEYDEARDEPRDKKTGNLKSKAIVKKEAKTIAKINTADEDNNLNDLPVGKIEESDANPRNQTPTTMRKAPKLESGDEGSDESHKKKLATRRRQLAKVESEDENTKMTHDPDHNSRPGSSEKPKDSFTKAPPSEDGHRNVRHDDGNESEMSILKDEDDEPKPKKRRRAKSSPTPNKSKPASKPNKASGINKDKDKPATPDELLLKTLQSQLKKCGLTKIWAFELKKFGTDTKAKINHLQAALRGVGMVGRFSEARAREIKEMRELQADVEAVKEGDRSWGMESGRARRSQKNGKKKGFQEDIGDEDEEMGSDAGSRSASEQPVAQRQNVRASLAFLGDEDSDE